MTGAGWGEPTDRESMTHVASRGSDLVDLQSSLVVSSPLSFLPKQQASKEVSN